MTTIHRVLNHRDTDKQESILNFVDPNSENPTEVAFVKGAPKEVLALCTRILINGEVRPLDAALRKQILNMQDVYARQTLRVLAFGFRLVSTRSGRYTIETVEKDLTFLGLMAMHDPPRPEVAEAVGNL